MLDKIKTLMNLLITMVRGKSVVNEVITIDPEIKNKIAKAKRSTTKRAKKK